MNKHYLPTTINIAGIDCEIYSDYRDILEIFEIFNDPDLLESEKVIVALDFFYKTDDYKKDYETATVEMMNFITQCSDETPSNTSKKPLYDWEQDFNIIVAPINKAMNTDIRGLEYLHWWTFLSAFMEIGECTFNTFVGIRDKLNKGIKLDKTEERIYKENRLKIVIKQKHDKVTQALMDEILGRE